MKGASQVHPTCGVCWRAPRNRVVLRGPAGATVPKREKAKLESKGRATRYISAVPSMAPSPLARVVTVPPPRVRWSVVLMLYLTQPVSAVEGRGLRSMLIVGTNMASSRLSYRQSTQAV